ncbi:hypothetical protein LguiA_024531 [Lonicera macranthoides]
MFESRGGINQTSQSLCLLSLCVCAIHLLYHRQRVLAAPEMKPLKDMWGHEHPLILKEDHKHVLNDEDKDDDEDDSDGYPEDCSCEAC